MCHSQFILSMIKVIFYHICLHLTTMIEHENSQNDAVSTVFSARQLYSLSKALRWNNISWSIWGSIKHKTPYGSIVWIYMQKNNDIALEILHIFPQIYPRNLKTKTTLTLCSDTSSNVLLIRGPSLPWPLTAPSR